MRFALAALALLPVAAFAEITILAPSPSEYWVQDTSNTVTWDYSSGDPNPIDINVVNVANTTLDGNFTIATYVNVSTQSFTVTNVTLVVGSDYQIQFVNPANLSEVYATSGFFSVKAPGTAAAPSVTPSSAAASASSSASGSAASGSAASGSASASGSAVSAAASSKSAAPRTFGTLSAQGVLGVIVTCGIAGMSALFL
ncbi:uncharacterized protein LAESUDRAFT_684045 [Laetiporus sulphureus 93-53]|uniref:Yeast cell wall synthesis Kre9/Knh1-like N-terminal domain-containing protein n=1 Tax=Laetiporus sulphureus 93-53 TaxID=1314785 RepID=A0A165CQU1_9APHY|nr:uncharacterized protein LAESUDRAFT_684045 [Laetiporus sulphureus 93-53]KZT03255.1 hypothetical protein LAESUDRAFT_684045 [Laetiporus sulphureus 93-53]